MSDLLQNVLQLSCMMKSYSSNHHHNLEIVQFVSYKCHYFIQGGDIIPVVGKGYAVDVFMLLSMTVKEIKLIIKSVHFAELHILQKMKI